MNKILLTGIGGDIAQNVAKIIRQHYPNTILIGTDVDTQHGGRLFVDVLYTLPPAISDTYLSALSGLIDSEEVKVVFPLTEHELSVLGALIKERNDINWVTAGDEVIKAGLDKLTTVKVLENLGITMPWTVSVKDAPPQEYPCILKSRFGSGSKAVFVVNNETEAKYLAAKHPDAIYQELLEPADQEVTCAVYRNKAGEVAVLQMLRKLVGGLTGWAQVIDNQSIHTICKKAAEGLKLSGSMNVQLRITKNGPRIFEINPRISSTVLMRHRLGFTDALWSLEEIEGKLIQYPLVKVGQTAVRVQDSVVLDNDR